jgi:hypothetical protein
MTCGQRLELPLDAIQRALALAAAEARTVGIGVAVGINERSMADSFEVETAYCTCCAGASRGFTGASRSAAQGRRNHDPRRKASEITIPGARPAKSRFPAQGREEDHVADAGRVGEQHH